MTIVLYFITKTVYFGLVVMQLLIFLRVMLSWFMLDDENAVIEFICDTAELFVAPIRALLEKSEWVRGLPFDISYIVAFVIISIVKNALPVIKL